MHNREGRQAKRCLREEARLFSQAQAGCRASLNRLMGRHKRLVVAVVRKQHRGGLSFAEVMQAGREGLWRAILGYEPQQGAAFCTYAWVCISRAIWRSVSQEKERQRREEEALAGWSWRSEGGEPAVDDDVEAVEKAIGDLVAQLPPRRRQVIEGYYGLNGEEGLSYRQLGLRLGVSHERIRQLRRQAEAWMSHPVRSALLRSLVDRHTLADYAYGQQLVERQQQWHRRRKRYGR